MSTHLTNITKWGKKKNPKKESSWESLGFKRLCCLYVSNNNNLLHTFYALVIVQVNSERIQSRLTPSAAASVHSYMVMLPDIWRPLQAANQAKDAARNLGGRSQPVFCSGIYIYIGLVVSRTLLTSVVELRQTRFSRVSISSNAQYVTLQTCFSHPSFSY
jgi:hypothetical protein